MLGLLLGEAGAALGEAEGISVEVKVGTVEGATEGVSNTGDSRPAWTYICRHVTLYTMAENMELDPNDT